MHLSRRRKDDCLKKLDLGEGRIIEAKKVGKLLGVMIDNKLNRKAHLEYVKTKAITSLGGLSPLSGSMRAARIITGAFKATLSPALDVEVYLLPLRQNLDKLTQESVMRIAESPSYSTLISTRSKCKNGRKTPLERLVMRYEQRTGLKSPISRRKRRTQLHHGGCPLIQPYTPTETKQ